MSATTCSRSDSARLSLAAAVSALLLGGCSSGSSEPGAAPSASPVPSTSASLVVGSSPPVTVAPTTPVPLGTPTSPAPGATASVPASTLPPKPLTATARPAATLQAKLTGLTSVTGTAELPGEVGGPSLRVAVTLTNMGTVRRDLTTTVVNLYYGTANTPANPLATGQTSFPAVLQPSRSATGLFVFRVPAEERGVVAVTVDVAADLPTVLFRGPAPR